MKDEKKIISTLEDIIGSASTKKEDVSAKSKTVVTETKGPVTETKGPVTETKDPVTETKNARQKAVAAAALKAAAISESNITEREAEKTYIIQKKKFMLNKCKNDEVVKFRALKIYAQYFGKIYTFLYNTIPVTVRFDDSVQEFPKFVYDFLMKKIAEVSNSNTERIDIEYRDSE